MTTMQEMQAMLDEIARGAETAQWEPKIDESGPAETYTANVNGWRVLALRYETGSAFAPHGYDGAATKGSVVLHLTKPLAERCFKCALKARS